MARRLTTIILVALVFYVAGYFVAVERGYTTNAGGTRGSAYISREAPWDSIYRPLIWLECRVRGGVLILSPMPFPDHPPEPSGRYEKSP